MGNEGIIYEIVLNGVCMSDILSLAKTQVSKIKIANLIYDPAKQSLTSQGCVIELEPRTIELLEMFLRHVGEPISNEQIIEEIWSSKYISKNVVTNRVSTLRTILKQHLTDIEPTKLIVTYPRKGYFVPTSLVSIIKTDHDSLQHLNDDNDITPPISSHAFSSAKYQRPRLWLSVLAILFLGVAMSMMPVQQDEFEPNTRLFIPQIELLLDKINCRDETAKPYLVPLKTMLLQSLNAYQYIELTNLQSPGYFLQRLDSSCRWPGALNNHRLTDFQLSFNVWMNNDNTEQLSIEAILYRASSKKVAWRNLYTSSPQKLHLVVDKITQDFAHYFALPKPSLDTEALQLSNLDALLEPNNWQNSTVNSLTYNEVHFLSRELFFSDATADEIETWINEVQRAIPTPDPELHIWLALLAYKSGQSERSLEMLNREYVAALADNAIIYLLKANLNAQVGQKIQYQDNYLQAMSALTAIVSPSVIIDHYRQPSLSQSCLDLWQQVITSQGLLEPHQAVMDNIKKFCLFNEYN